MTTEKSYKIGALAATCYLAGVFISECIFKKKTDKLMAQIEENQRETDKMLKEAGILLDNIKNQEKEYETLIKEINED